MADRQNATAYLARFYLRPPASSPFTLLTITMETTADKNVERAGQLDCASLSDALDRLGIVGQCYRIKPRDSKFRMAGRAFTILYGPSANPPGTVGDVIPQEHEERVLAEAANIEEAENKIRAAVRSGMRLDEARKVHKYHQLQSRKK